MLMKKITLLLVSVLLSLGAMAQASQKRLTAGELNAVTTKLPIAIKCTQEDNYTQYYNGTSQRATELSNAIIFYWVPVQEGSAGTYYITKGDGENDYLQKDNIINFGAKESAAQFHAVKPYAGGAGVNNVENFGGANIYEDQDTGGEYYVRIAFADNSKWFNFNGNVYNTGTGVWTVQNVYDMTGVDFEATEPTPGDDEVQAPQKRLTADELNAVVTKLPIAIKCTQMDNYTKYYNGNGLTDELSNNIIFYWVPVQEGVAGAYYITRGDGENDYLQPDNIKAFGPQSTAAQFHAVKPYPDGIGVEFFGGADSYEDVAVGGAYYVRIAFIDDSKWFNFNGNVYNSGPGVWSVQNVYDMSADSEEPTDPAPGEGEEGGEEPTDPAPGEGEEGGEEPTDPAPGEGEEGGEEPTDPAPGEGEEGGEEPTDPTPGEGEGGEGGEEPTDPAPEPLLVDFTFVRGTESVAVKVEGAEGVAASIASNVGWLANNAMASRVDVLCPNRNTSAASGDQYITYTLAISGLAQGQAFSAAKYTNIAVNSAGNLQPANNVDIRHCNFTLSANDVEVASLADQNIWIVEGETDRVIELAGEVFAADAEGNLVLVLKLEKGTDNKGCFYGLTKIELVAMPTEHEGEEGGEEPTDPAPGEGEEGEGGEVGVVKTAANSQQPAVIYDLMGRRVEKMEKGIYIVNGRKVLVK